LPPFSANPRRFFAAPDMTGFYSSKTEYHISETVSRLFRFRAFHNERRFFIVHNTP
jgi:hypothetical protein